MAKRVPQRPARSAPPPRAKAKSKKPATAVGVEVVEDTPGMGFEAGVAIATSVILVAAILFLDKLLGQFGKGLFFS